MLGTNRLTHSGLRTRSTFGHWPASAVAQCCRKSLDTRRQTKTLAQIWRLPSMPPGAASGTRRETVSLDEKLIRNLPSLVSAPLPFAGSVPLTAGLVDTLQPRYRPAC
jgi:hypothetical protein